MNDEARRRLKTLLTSQRVLSLSVLVDGKPHLGLLPYALKLDFTAALVHASTLARHTRGLQPGAPFAILVHAPDQADADPLQLPRVTLTGEVHPIERDTPQHAGLRDVYLQRFPSSEVTFELGDFKLFELRFREGRYVEGFASAANVTADVLRQMAQES